MMMQYERRMAWKWALKDTDKKKMMVNIQRKATDEVTPFFGLIVLVLQAWLHGLRSCILGAARRARAVHRRRDLFKHAGFG